MLGDINYFKMFLKFKEFFFSVKIKMQVYRRSPCRGRKYHLGIIFKAKMEAVETQSIIFNLFLTPNWGDMG